MSHGQPAEVVNQVVKKPTSEMELVDLEMYIEEFSSWIFLGVSQPALGSRSNHLHVVFLFNTWRSDYDWS